MNTPRGGQLLKLQPLRRQLAKLGGFDLVAACQRDVVIVEKKHVARHLVARQPFPQVFADLLGSDASPVMRDNAGDDNLAERRVRQADRLRHLYGGMLSESFI